MSQEHNVSGLLPWEEPVLERYFAECQSVLVAAAGAGREVVSLSEQVTRVDAFDCVEALIVKGKRLDGRKPDELRPVKIEAGVLQRADGSAWQEGND